MSAEWSCSVPQARGNHFKFTDIYQEDHFIHVPAAPSMSKQQTYFKDKNSLQHMPTVSSNNL